MVVPLHWIARIWEVPMLPGTRDGHAADQSATTACAGSLPTLRRGPRMSRSAGKVASVRNIIIR